MPADNTTGYKGVYFVRGKYVAKIVFQKKAYYLGNFDDIEEKIIERYSHKMSDLELMRSRGGGRGPRPMFGEKPKNRKQTLGRLVKYLSFNILLAFFNILS